MPVILVVGFIMSLFLIALLTGKKEKVVADKFLISMFAVYALSIGGTSIDIYNSQNDYPFPHLMNISWLFLLLHGPLLWFYIKYLTAANFKIKNIHLLHFAPFTIYFLIHYFNFIQLPAVEKIALVNQHATRVAPKIGTLVIGLSTIGYNVAALYLLRMHRKNIRNKFSFIENIDLKWLQTFAIASLAIFSLNVVLFILNNHLQITDDNKLSAITFSFSTIYVFYIGYFGIKQGRIFVDYPNPVFQTLKPSEQIKPKKDVSKDYSETINKLTQLMEQEQPYLDPELNLAKLSSLIKTKPELISEVLNSSLNQNFFDYINKYRIEEFKLRYLSEENKHLSIIGIAYDCGFNSKAAFYRAFNKFEGMSPTAYISKVSL